MILQSCVCIRLNLATELWDTWEGAIKVHAKFLEIIQIKMNTGKYRSFEDVLYICHMIMQNYVCTRPNLAKGLWDTWEEAILKWICSKKLVCVTDNY